MAVIECLRNDNREKRLTLGFQQNKALWQWFQVCESWEQCTNVMEFLGFTGEFISASVWNLYIIFRGFLSSLLLYIPSSMTFWLSYYNALALLRNTRASLSRSSSDTREDLLLLQAISGSFGGIVCQLDNLFLPVLKLKTSIQFRL